MFSPDDYTIAISFFLRLLGAIYFFAFGAFLFQIKGLLGKNGILPIVEHLNLLKRDYPKRCYRLVPTLFWLNSSDTMLMAVVSIGTLLSVLLMLGVFPPLLLFLLYVLYLSIVSAGQDFLSFGWEGFLLEITANAFFLSLSSSPNLFVWISLNLILFRFQSKDPNWRNLTGTFFHYQSQPIPNTIAWYAYKLPIGFHQLSTFLMLFIEIVIPFGMLGPDWMRFGVFIAFVGLQFFIWLTGNFSFLNHLTVVLSVILVANIYIPLMETPPVEPTPWIVYSLCTLAGVFLITLQILQLWLHFFPYKFIHKWLEVFGPYHLSNRYGIFAIMTTKRYEVVFEGSNDQEHWEEYLFYYKPSEVDRRPRRISPYQPRLDWQAWFLPFGSMVDQNWVQHFIYHLLKGTPEVLNLIRGNPFVDHPPKYVRASMYDYTFTTFEERKKTGAWWNRKYVGLFNPVMHLNP
jgi:hypothetical protein